MGGVLVPFGGLSPRSLLLTPLASGLACLCLRHQPQQMVPAEPDPTIASAAGLLVSTVREAALAAIPLLDRLLPLGNRQTPESLALVQGVSRRILALPDGARPLLPRSRAEHLAVGSTPPLRGICSGSQSRIPLPLGCHFPPVRAPLVTCRLDWWQGLCLTGFRLRRFSCHQSRQMGLYQLQVDLRISHMLLCRLQVPFRIPQVGLSGSHVLLSGHLGSRLCQSDFRRHRPTGTCYLTPQYAESRGDDWKPLLNHLGPLLQFGCPLDD